MTKAKSSTEMFWDRRWEEVRERYEALGLSRGAEFYPSITPAASKAAKDEAAAEADMLRTFAL